MASIIASCSGRCRAYYDGLPRQARRTTVLVHARDSAHSSADPTASRVFSRAVDPHAPTSAPPAVFGAPLHVALPLGLLTAGALFLGIKKANRAGQVDDLAVLCPARSAGRLIVASLAAGRYRSWWIEATWLQTAADQTRFTTVSPAPPRTWCTCMQALWI